ncbi:hypothetical protein LCI18_002900 [Fusarium solani-melongenae]|uniref:Uncharacterized protein n=1 Tax=Fusarium solani subsp. cucurbitae TaxID=2747967 RepID=A0ACD3YSN9_FUSSC|nr:hypothetical protein LCI18_002900 [Fusarium solani-melongenae]
MSQNPRATGVAQSDTDSALDRAMGLLKEAEEAEKLELPRPAMGSGVQQGERKLSQWRKKNIRRILGRLRVSTSDLKRALKDPQSIRVLSGKSRSEYPESERPDLVHKAELLKLSSYMVKDDAEELNELYVRGEDSPTIEEVSVMLVKRNEVLESVLKRF